MWPILCFAAVLCDHLHFKSSHIDQMNATRQRCCQRITCHDEDHPLHRVLLARYIRESCFLFDAKWWYHAALCGSRRIPSRLNPTLAKVQKWVPSDPSAAPVNAVSISIRLPRAVLFTRRSAVRSPPRPPATMALAALTRTGERCAFGRGNRCNEEHGLCAGRGRLGCGPERS